MAQPYFIDATDKLVDEFYDQFENEMGEQLFMFIAEQGGRHRRTMIQAADEVVGAIYADPDSEEYFEQSQQLAGEIMTKMLRRYAESY